MIRQSHNIHFSTAADTAYERLRTMILVHELVSGQKLSEIGLSEQLGVSRTPIREALRRLSADGFVLLVPNSGAWVASPEREEVEDVAAVRLRLETWAGELAVKRITPLQLARLDEIIDAEDDIYQSRDTQRYLALNTDFHMIIAEAAGNSVLLEYIKDVLAKSYIYMVLMGHYFDFDRNPSVDEHKKMIAALRARDEGLFIELVERHVEIFFSDLKLPETKS